jgi:3-methylcrotonyl-CoA carboxylase alpha subunit
MEMNTRLQVEHPVTEAVTGEDLVSWQFKVAAGEALPLTQQEIAERISQRGWAIEARIYAENPNQNFMPDSGKLLHLRTPQPNDTVRIDAGFVQGDTISSNYDGMIAKLIVRGSTRPEAIRKLRTALEDYEVVGLSTNIEFLKKVCQSPAFINGDVETGYIQKHYDELFLEESVEIESFAQAALALSVESMSSLNGLPPSAPHGELAGFEVTNERLFHFLPPDGKNENHATVTVTQVDRQIFNVLVEGPNVKQAYANIRCESKQKSITSFFPHTRIHTTWIADGDNITLFQRGRQTKLKLASPPWYEKALGIKDIHNSVLAPMPCKVLRNEVKEGDQVEKDQALVVYEFRLNLEMN